MKVIISVFISIMPVQPIKIWLYRVLLGYKIDYRCTIGFFNVLNCKDVKMQGARIGHFNYIDASNLQMQPGSRLHKFNRIKHINTLLLEKEAVIYAKNFIGGSRNKDNLSNQNVKLGFSTQVLRSNYFDVVNSITVGRNVVFGGNGSEIWTHGFDTQRNLLTSEVSFGNDIFVGSGCTFTKGVAVADNVIIAPASVVYKSITEPGIYSTHEIKRIK